MGALSTHSKSTELEDLTYVLSTAVLTYAIECSTYTCYMKMGVYSGVSLLKHSQNKA